MDDTDAPAGAESQQAVRASAAAVRAVLELTHHQLGELTSGLALEVGDRPNYPRYDRSAVHRMVAATALRELRCPLDVAIRAARDYAPQVLAGRGWLLAAPAADNSWSVTFVSTGPDLVQWLRAAGGRALVLDLDRTLVRADDRWEDVTAAG